MARRDVFMVAPTGQGKSLTIGDLQGATTYYFYIRRINAYGVSDFIVVSATTKNEAAKYLQVISGEIRKTDLYQDLSDEIDLISGPQCAPGHAAQAVGLYFGEVSSLQEVEAALATL